MAQARGKKSGGTSRASLGSRPKSTRSGAGAGAKGKNTANAKKKQPAPPTFDTSPEAARTFRLGVIPGATPGKWIDAWKERMPHVRLEVVPISVDDQRTALDGLDAALVRLPMQGDDVSAIPLYDELPVVMMSSDSNLTVAAELTADDLSGEVVIVPRDDVLGVIEIPGAVAPKFAPPADTEEAVKTVAAGVGVVIVPMSLARLYQRKDVVRRPFSGGPTSRVALAWLEAHTTPDVEAFVGIVRGRTTQSSRG